MSLARAVAPACLALSLAFQGVLFATPAHAEAPESQDVLLAPGSSLTLQEGAGQIQTRRFRALAALLIALSARTATTISPSIIGPQTITLVGHLPEDEVNIYTDNNKRE